MRRTINFTHANLDGYIDGPAVNLAGDDPHAATNIRFRIDFVNRPIQRRSAQPCH